MRESDRIEKVEITERISGEPLAENAFLSLERLRVINHYLDGTKSREYDYDVVLRKWLDAVVLVLTSTLDGRPAICLRACIRPPLLLRPALNLPQPDERVFHTLWEVPAGLVEAGDVLVERARAEVLEETGYSLPQDAFSLMSGAPFLSPGALPERLYFICAHVNDIETRISPVGDGSPVEEGSSIWWVAIEDALEMCEKGEIVDVKTELALRRLVASRSK